MKTFISLGLGVQSTWLYYASTFGYLPKADAAIFADLGKEKKKTLEYLDWLLRWADKNSDIPIHVIQNKNLFKDLLNKENSTGQRFVSIPAFTKNEDGSYGMLRRQCTKEYKIEQVDKKIRELCGLKPRQKMTEKIEVYMGVSLDEIDRMSIPARKWKIHVYPFCGYTVPADGDAQKCAIDYRKTRLDIIAEYDRHKLPVPPKSSCVFCPYQSDAAWYDMKVNEPEDFKAAVEVDEAIRNSTRKGIVQPAYLHDSCKPLNEVDFSAQASNLWKGECSGVCHL